MVDAAWLNVSQKSRVGIGMNSSTVMMGEMYRALSGPTDWILRYIKKHNFLRDLPDMFVIIV